eukprot:TRINITY_DN5298_c0_g1_i2.p1 TRINITY_DN5298_c0_g1~~TRINITY_DN5298_c0_g1_i2.p1  ORF type:complete len:419 (-),score=72.49 TRINITY_DN5298_c0_g1_i2:41-1297(-)
MGGAQIIDMALMVVDIQKGIQTQTAEGLVIAQITVDEMVVVINKIDSVPIATRAQKIDRVKAGLKKAFSATKFGSAAMIPYSAKDHSGKSELLEAMAECARRIIAKKLSQPSIAEQNLLFLVDHCFPIKGKGTVATGTIIRGTVKPNQDIYIPHLATSKKVKSIQMFKQPVQEAKGGDRVGILLTQFDSNNMERGIVCGKAGEVPLATQAIVRVTKIGFYKQPIKSKAKFHVTVGHTTTMATFQFFGTSDEATDFVIDKEYVSVDTLEGESSFALMTLETPTFCPLDWIFISSKLDTDIHVNQCRLAFHGHIVQQIEPQQIEKMKVYTLKEKEGKIERSTSNTSAIGVNLFKKETDMNLFVNMKVFLENGVEGKISGTFGKSGKFKVEFREPQEDLAGQIIKFPVKRYIFDKTKQLRQ